MQFKFWLFEMSVFGFQDRSQKSLVQSEATTTPRRGVEEVWLLFLSFLFLADYEGWIFTQYVVYGDGSLYSYRTICWNIWHGFKTIFSVFSSQYIVKWCMLCSKNVFYQIIKTGMYYRKLWSVCFWIKHFLSSSQSCVINFEKKWWCNVRQQGMFLQVHNRNQLNSQSHSHTHGHTMKTQQLMQVFVHVVVPVLQLWGEKPAGNDRSCKTTESSH